MKIMLPIDIPANNNLNTPLTSPNPPATTPDPTTAVTPMTSTTGINQDYLVTEKRDPNSLTQDQLSKDLEALRGAELTTDTEIKLTSRLTAPAIRPEDLPLKRVKEIDVLRLKNPFRGI